MIEHNDTPVDRTKPWMEAGRIGFRLLYAVTILAALAWTVSNIREVGPDDQAVVFRFGVAREVRHAGLLIAWPRPIEQIVLIPSPERVLEWRVHGLADFRGASRSTYYTNYAEDDDASREENNRPPLVGGGDTAAGSGYLLTGDAGVVQLDVSVFYKVSDPYDYVLQRDHVVAALDRLATRNAVVLCAGRDLDSILVARPELVGSNGDAAERRERLRAELVDGINRSLVALKSSGAGLGIHIDRVDIRAGLPTPAVDAFNAVLTASQKAQEAIAAAQNNAAKKAQEATQAANRIIQAAQASADERVAKAKADTATILSLAQTVGNGQDPSLLRRLYRDRMKSILAQAASVTAVDPATGGRLILQGSKK
ncbi:MAG: SPFH domain-containing protein [Rhizobiaceae bacterium]